MYQSPTISASILHTFDLVVARHRHPSPPRCYPIMSPNSRSKADRAFSLLDLVRVGAGLLLLNAFASWWFTSTPTWGHSGKWIDPRFWKFKALGSEVHLTLDQLALFNGSDPTLPIYVAVNGSVYDVSASPRVYGPKGPYRFFSGRDAARAFVTGCFQKPDELTYDLRGIDPDEAVHDIKSWQEYYHHSSRYWFVGTVEHLPLTGEPPSACVHVKFPH